MFVAVVGTNIPPEFIPSCEKGAKVACAKGVLAGYPISGKPMHLIVRKIMHVVLE